MNAEEVTCPMCGQRFDPRDHIACQSCPLKKGCQLICCPACGFEMVDVRQSALARLAARWIRTDRKDPPQKPTSLDRRQEMISLSNYFKSKERNEYSRVNPQNEPQLTLKDLPPGHTAKVAGFSSRILPDKRALLRAYGLVPGYQVRVMQHSPVSIIQVEHTEIALEPELAAGIFITGI